MKEVTSYGYFFRKLLKYYIQKKLKIDFFEKIY